MLDFLKRHRRTIIALGLVVLALAGMVLPGPISARARGGLGTAFAPAQAAVSRMGRSLGRLTRPLVTSWRRGRRVEALETEVAQLRGENAQLLGRLAARRREEADAIALRHTLPAARLEFIVAPVIGRDSCTWSKTITVGRGWQSGVSRGQLVISSTDRVVAAGTSDGVAEGDMVLDGARVVGRVSAVGPFHCVVRLVTDPSSVMRAQVVAERDGKVVRTGSGILKGSITGRAKLRLEFVDRREDVRPGDVVLTAGYGGVLPAPLVVGRVETVESSAMPLLSDVTVSPEANLEALRRVMIVHERPRLSAALAEEPPP